MAVDDEKAARLAKLQAWKQQQQQAGEQPHAPAAGAPVPQAAGPAPQAHPVPPPAAPSAAADLAAAVCRARDTVAAANAVAAAAAQLCADSDAALPPASASASAAAAADDEEVDPLDAFMAAEVMPEVVAKEVSGWLLPGARLPGVMCSACSAPRLVV